MSRFVIPIIILLLIVFATIKRINCYDCFVSGSKNALKLCVSIFPYIFAIFIAISLFRVSGLAEILSNALAPIFNFLGIPPELTELIIIRPLSGNGSIAILDTIYVQYGADSYIGRVASVLVGASETIFYVVAVYFSTTKIKKMRGGIAISLIASFVGIIVTCILIPRA